MNFLFEKNHPKYFKTFSPRYVSCIQNQAFKFNIMIRFTCMLAAGLLAFNVSNAQSPQNLKGPKAKNYKPWKERARTGAVMVKLDEPALKGPVFKNQKARDSQFNKAELETQLKMRDRITGPKAKNKKVWKKD